ncbi:universal stress protein [Salinimicrobium flavum]|uniref:Universal stress protein n=1 Tax=Salinimicrobium flavum TaxID=1737065 RepID=A0ABW5J1J5_9FLAO
MTIIAASDFSELAENAVDYAADVARLVDGNLVVFHSFTLSIHAANSGISAEHFRELFEERKQRLKIRAKELSETFGISVKHEISFAFVEDELKRLIEKYKARLVVLGMNQKSLEQDLLGNRTANMIKDLKIPILAVPQHARFAGTKKLLFACDVSREIPEKIWEKIKDAVMNLQGEVEIFSVNEKVEELQAGTIRREQFNRNMGGINYLYKNVQSNDVIGEIEKEIMASDADILIMVPQKYGFWESIVHRSKTREMASGLDIPLLSIPG